MAEHGSRTGASIDKAQIQESCHRRSEKAKGRLGVSGQALDCNADMLTSDFSLGLEGIIRLTFEIAILRGEHASSYVKKKVARDQQNALDALQAWDQRKRRSTRNR